MRVLG
ncbi:unnamed protein product [Linum tenue]